MNGQTTDGTSSHSRRVLLCALILTSLTGNSFGADLTPLNIPICTAPGDQGDQIVIVSDGAGGAIVVWSDFRNGTDYDIYAQRITGQGVLLWLIDGVPVCTAPGNQQFPAVVPDGTGGALIAWVDLRHSSDADIYAQRISSAGEALWNADGIRANGAPNNQYVPDLASDGAGGAIVAWSDNRNGTDYDIYAQRIGPDGGQQWHPPGVPVCTAAGDQNKYGMLVVPDGIGGAVIAWRDRRAGGIYDDVFIQRLSSSGQPLWTQDGVGLTNGDVSNGTAIVSDGSGGAFVTWAKRTGIGGTNDDVIAQHVDGTGTPQWKPALVVCDTLEQQDWPAIIRDQGGHVIICWRDSRSGGNIQADIFAQRISDSGLIEWTANGVPVCTAPNAQSDPTMVSDASGGAIVAWMDERVAADIYGQRVDQRGDMRWEADGVAVSRHMEIQKYPKIVAADSGGAIVVWQDARNGYSNWDVYAQVLPSASSPAAVAGVGVGDVRLHPPAPNPATKAVRIIFSTGRSRSARLLVYDISGRVVRHLEGGLGTGDGSILLDLRDDRGQPLRVGLYILVLEAEGVHRSQRLAVVR